MADRVVQEGGAGCDIGQDVGGGGLVAELRAVVPDLEEQQLRGDSEHPEIGVQQGQ